MAYLQKPKYPKEYVIEGFFPSDAYFADEKKVCEFAVGMLGRWGYNQKADCEFLYILYNSGNSRDPTKFKISRFAAEDLQEELDQFLAEHEAETAGKRGRFVVLSRFTDEAKLFAPKDDTYFINPDFDAGDGAVLGRYQGDKPCRNYRLHLKNPVPNSGIPKWSGPVIELNLSDMKGLVAFIKAATAEMEKKIME